MAGQAYPGRVVQTVGLVAAPQYEPLHRLFALTGRYAEDLDGSAGTVVGYDRGDAAHSFNGPVRIVPNPTAAINATASAAGVYTPQGEFQDSVSQNPGLDPYSRLLWQRMGR